MQFFLLHSNNMTLRTEVIFTSEGEEILLPNSKKWSDPAFDVRESRSEDVV